MAPLILDGLINICELSKRQTPERQKNHLITAASNTGADLLANNVEDRLYGYNRASTLFSLGSSLCENILYVHTT